MTLRNEDITRIIRGALELPSARIMPEVRLNRYVAGIPMKIIRIY